MATKRLITDNVAIPTRQHIHWLLQIMDRYEEENNKDHTEDELNSVQNITLVLENCAGRLYSQQKHYRFLLVGFVITNLAWFSIYMGWA
jgi:predicted site-specific integrase-resolvase